MTDCQIRITYDGDTHHLACFTHDPDGEAFHVLEVGTSWEQMQAAVRAHRRSGPDPDADALQRTAVDTAVRALDEQRLWDPGTDRHTLVEAALDAASNVYAAAEDAAVDQVLADAGLVGLEPVSDGVRIRLKHSQDLAAGMVAAFDQLVQTSGAQNYVESESTVTDPARAAAIDAGLPPEEWPAPRRYRFIVVKPDGLSPHELRLAAEQARDTAQAETTRLRQELRAIAEMARHAGPTPLEYVSAALEIETRARAAADGPDPRVQGRMRRFTATPDTIALLDEAMHCIWLHGQWRDLTVHMDTESREAAADAVERRHLIAVGRGLSDVSVRSLRWWRA